MVPHSPEIPNRVEIFSPSLLIATFLARLIFKRVLCTWKREKRKKNRRANRYRISNSPQTTNFSPSLNSFPNILQGSSNKDVPVCRSISTKKKNLFEASKKLRKKERERERFYFFHELLKAWRQKREGEEGRCHVLNRRRGSIFLIN